MANSDFSWFKIASFFGALVLVVLCFIMLGFGIGNVVEGETIYGGACIFAGILVGGLAVLVYNNYQRKSSV